MDKLEIKWQEYNKGLISHYWGVQIFLNDVNVTNDIEVIKSLIKRINSYSKKSTLSSNFMNKKNHITYIN